MTKSYAPCDRCGAAIYDGMQELGWPVPLPDSGADGYPVYVGPCCGDGYCECGRLKSVWRQDKKCAWCRGGERQ